MGVSNERLCVLTVVIKTKQHAEAEILDTPLNRPVHSSEVIPIVGLRATRMHKLICRLMVSLLKQLVCAYAGGL